MSDSYDSDLRRAERRAFLAGSSVFALTSIHHVYGAIRYDTPERYFAAVIAAVAVIMSLGALQISRARSPSPIGRAAWLVFLGVNATVFVLLFGAFEGLYNHGLKDALYFGGAPLAQMRVLFPSPVYEMPNDWFFEVTGVLQIVPAAVTAYYLVRLIRVRPIGRLRNAGAHTWASLAASPSSGPNDERRVLR
jgi:hypothetical protein